MMMIRQDLTLPPILVIRYQRLTRVFIIILPAGKIILHIAAGVNGLHLYTLNRWEKITEVLNAAGLGG